jgi:hypothetical protein
MGKKGGGGGQDSTQTVINELPDYARPYYDQVMAMSGEKLDNTVGWDSFKDSGRTDAKGDPILGAYIEPGEEGYGGTGIPTYMGGDPNARIAATAPELLAADQARKELFDNPNRMYQQFSNDQMNLAAATNANMEAQSSGGAFYDLDENGISNAQKYMNPYQQLVTDNATRAATTSYEQQRDRRAATSAAAGGRGGYRDNIMDAIGQSSLAGELGNIVGDFGSQGYMNAQQQWNADRTAAMNAVNNRNAMRQTQSGIAGGLATQSRGFGQSDYDQRLREIGGMESVGYRHQGESQIQKDLLYSDWMREQNYLQDQMANQMGMLSGMPMKNNMYTSDYSPVPGMGQQLMATGIGMAGLDQAFGSGSGGGIGSLFTGG